MSDGIPSVGRPLTADDVVMLRDGDVLSHRSDGRFVFSGRNKLRDGPAALEVRQLGRPETGWRFIAFSAFEFLHRPQRLATPTPTEKGEK